VSYERALAIGAKTRGLLRMMALAKLLVLLLITGEASITESETLLVLPPITGCWGLLLSKNVD
jgi:hypothetical protein